MRLIVATPEIPWPTDSGSKQRSYALLRALAAVHSVTLTAPAGADDAWKLGGLSGLMEEFIGVPTQGARRRRLPAAGNRIVRLGSYCADWLHTSTPYLFRLETDVWRERIAGVAGDYDAAFCRYSFMADVLADFPSDRVVVDADDLQFVGLRRAVRQGQFGWGAPMGWLEAQRSRRHEQRLFNRVARTLVCSEVDLQRVSCARKSVVRNGVDLPNRETCGRMPDAELITFVGTFTYAPNVEGLQWFVEKVWPRLRSALPNLRLEVVGKGGSPESLPFARVPGVSVIGEVKCPSKAISRSLLTVVPLMQGTGTRIKIAESLACGRPVVSTSIGAEGYEALTEDDGLICSDRPDGFAAAIEGLCRAPERAREIGEAGRRLAERSFSWESITASLATDMERWTNGDHRSARLSRQEPRIESHASGLAE